MRELKNWNTVFCNLNKLAEVLTQEDLDMIRHKSVGLQQAAETLESISLGKTLHWMFEEHLKAKRNR